MEKNEIIKKAMRYVNKLLLPLEWLYYHQYNHSLEVMNRAIYLWEKEKVSNESLEILALAWLFHDTGFIIEYDSNEQFWAKIARNYLKTILYCSEKTKIIERLILATDPNYKEPKDLLEKIIKDSDLDNLWREDFFAQKDKMKHEIEVIKKIKINDPEWDHGSLMLLNEHKYYTETQNNERLPKKIENRKILEDFLSKI